MRFVSTVTSRAPTLRNGSAPAAGLTFVTAGTYNLFMRPAQQGDWDVIFTTPVRWGTMFDQATPVLEVKATPQRGPAQEWLAYHFEDLSDDSATLIMRWEETMVPITISTQ